MADEQAKKISKQVFVDPSRIQRASEPRPTEDISPEWDTFRPLASIEDDLNLKENLDRIRGPLSKIEKVLRASSKLLDKARSIVQLFSIFESVFNNLLYSFLNSILDQLQRMLDDAKSTGVYMLDLVSYHFVNDSDSRKIADLDYEQTMARPAWSESANTNDTEENTPSILKGKNLLESIKETYLLNEDEDTSIIKGLMNNVRQGYRKETYNEFIQVICDSFEDPNDVPSGALGYEYLNPTEKSLEETTNLEIEPLWDTRFVQSGRPMFGPNASMHVYVIAFAVPAFDDLMRLFNNIITLVKDFPGSELVAPLADYFRDTRLLSDMDDDQRAIINYKLAEEYDKIYGTLGGNRGREPNFIGINLYSLMAPIFDTIQELIDRARSFTVIVDTGLSDMLMKIIDGIQDEIERLLNIITMINHFITMLESIIAITGLRVLKISTNEGNAGVVKALKNATGFGGDSRQDKDISREKKERVQRNKLELDERDQELKKENIEKEIKSWEDRKKHLQELNEIVLEWAEWADDPTRNLFVKQQQLPVLLENFDIQIAEKEEEIQELIDNNITFDELNILETKANEKHNEKLNGKDFSGDGVNDIDGLYKEKENLEEELANLEAQKNDPEQSDPENYEERKNDLENLIIGKQNEIDQEINRFNEEIADIHWVRDSITESTDDYETQLSNAESLLAAEKINRDDQEIGSDAETFRLQDEEYDTLIANAEQEINDLQDEQIKCLSGRGDSHGDIAFNTNGEVDPRDYPKETYYPEKERLPNIDYKLEDLRPPGGYGLDTSILQFPPADEGFNNNAWSSDAFSNDYLPSPSGVDDSEVIGLDGNIFIADSPVTYQVWEEIYTWATTENPSGSGTREDDGVLYTFENEGRQGGDEYNPGDPEYGPVGNNLHPVTQVSWRDVIIWCNAFSEKMGRTPIYVANGTNSTTEDEVLRSSVTDDYDGANVEDVRKILDTNGFRLPSIMEWEYAARYRGNDDTNATREDTDYEFYFTKGNSASGATSTSYDSTTAVALYNFIQTNPVKQRIANTLNLYDMSGNVDEWCDDIDGTSSFYIGGNWNSPDLTELRIGYNTKTKDFGVLDNFTGFRLCLNTNTYYNPGEIDTITFNSITVTFRYVGRQVIGMYTFGVNHYDNGFHPYYRIYSGPGNTTWRFGHQNHKIIGYWKTLYAYGTGIWTRYKTFIPTYRVGYKPILNTTLYNYFLNVDSENIPILDEDRIPTDYWNAEYRAEEIGNTQEEGTEIYVLNENIQQWQIEKEQNLEAWEEFNTENIRSQEKIILLIKILETEIALEILINQKNILIDAKENETLSQEIANIKATGWTQFLRDVTQRYYKGREPKEIKQKDGSYQLEDWVYNEVGYLKYKSNYNMQAPQIEKNEEENQYRCKIIEAAIKTVETELENIQIKKNSIDAELQQTKDKAADFDQEHAPEEQPITSWSPTMKMYYGGYLFCVGWPNVADTDYYNLSSVYNVHKDSAENAGKSAWNQLKKIIG